MSDDLFQGQRGPVHIPAMAPFKSVNASPPPHSNAVPGMQPTPPRADVEPGLSRATNPDAVDVTLPLSGTGSAPAGRRRPLVGPMVGVKPLADPNYTPDGKPTQLPPADAGTAEGGRITSIGNRKSATGQDIAALIASWR